MQAFDENAFKAENVACARRDIRERTLSKIGVPLERLVYLASLRDYGSGRYFHDGLAMRFSEQVAAEALKQEHVELFRELVHTPLQVLVAQLSRYFDSLSADRAESIRTWECLEPYRVVVPMGVDGLAIRLFLFNLRIAVAVLATQQPTPLVPTEIA